MGIQFTQNARKAVLWAQEEAMRLGQPTVEPEHLLLGLVHGDDTSAIRLLDRLGVAASQVRDALAPRLTSGGSGTPLTENSQISPATRKLLDHAATDTAQTDGIVGTDHLMMALLGTEGAAGTAVSVLESLGVTHARAAGALDSVQAERLSAPTAPRRPRRQEVRPGFLKGRDLLSVSDLSRDEIRSLFELTREIKSGHAPDNGKGKSLALVFEKPSLRTRVTFSVAMSRLGGESIYLSPAEIGLGTREPADDVARCLSRWVDAIAARTFSHGTAVTLAAAADVPVINALTDHEHPCQALADFYTILEKKAATEGMKLAFVGDGNNVAHSLMLLAPLMGTHFALACPPGYEPHGDVLRRAQALAAEHGTQMVVTSDAMEAADDADVLYTDVWTSMGQEEESEKRARDFAGFQVNDDLVREAKQDVAVLHCLPAHRGHEITATVLDGPQAAVFDQAENRLHVQMALLAAVL